MTEDLALASSLAPELTLVVYAFEVLLWASFAGGLVLDYVSMKMAIRSRRLKKGPSPIVFLGFLLMALRAATPLDLLHGIHHSVAFYAARIATAAALHGTFQFVIPYYATWRGPPPGQ